MAIALFLGAFALTILFGIRVRRADATTLDVMLYAVVVGTTAFSGNIALGSSNGTALFFAIVFALLAIVDALVDVFSWLT